MPRTSFLLTLLLCLIAAVSQAQGLVYEVDDKPLFEIDFPDGWVVDLDFADEAREAGAYEEGDELTVRIVEANPGDGGKVWVGLWVVPDAGSLDEGLGYFTVLSKDLFTNLDISDPQSTELNGMPARVLTATGKREGEDIELILALFEPRAGIIAAALYVGAADTWRSYKAELDGMVASLEPAG